MSDFLTHAGALSGSHTKLEGVVPVDNDAKDELKELKPYRSLDAGRLKLSGLGHWDPVDYLDDALRMAYVEPDSLLTGSVPLLRLCLTGVVSYGGWSSLPVSVF